METSTPVSAANSISSTTRGVEKAGSGRRVFVATWVLLGLFVLVSIALQVFTGRTFTTLWFVIGTGIVFALVGAALAYFVGRRSWKAANIVMCVLLVAIAGVRVRQAMIVKSAQKPTLAAGPTAQETPAGLALRNAVTVFNRDLQQLIAENDAAALAFRATGGIEQPAPDAAGVAARLEASRRMVGEATAVVKFIEEAPQTLRRHAMTANAALSAAQLDEAMPVCLDRMSHEAMRENADARLGSANAVHQLMQVLDRAKGGWTVENNQYAFAEDEAIDAFNSAVEALNQAAAREDAARRELLKRSLPGIGR